MYIQTRPRRNLGNLGASGSMQWYLGQHGKVRQALINNDLRGALDAAAALNDLGIENKRSEEVFNSIPLLTSFKESVTVRHAPGGFYTRDSLNLFKKDAAQIAVNLVNQAIQRIQAQQAAQQAETLQQQQVQQQAAQQQMAQQAQAQAQAQAQQAQQAQAQAQALPMAISQPVTVSQSGAAQPAQPTGRRANRRRRDLPQTYLTASGVERKIVTDPRKVAQQGGQLPGSNMTVKQALTSKDQYFFTRSSDQPGANRVPDFWSDLGPVPPGFDEQKYLAKNPDVAKAVAIGAMPSGLWHFLKYGKNENRALAGWKATRRPGYLSGIFANWHWTGQ